MHGTKIYAWQLSTMIFPWLERQRALGTSSKLFPDRHQNMTNKDLKHAESQQTPADSRKCEAQDRERLVSQSSNTSQIRSLCAWFFRTLYQPTLESLVTVMFLQENKPILSKCELSTLTLAEVDAAILRPFRNW